jgi:hypothetical protein
MRRRVPLILALMGGLTIPLLHVATTAADTPPIQLGSCFISDDGAGFTSAQLVQGGEVSNSGQHPANPGCNAGASASPPQTMLSGDCGTPQHPSPCSAQGSASSDADTTEAVPAGGAATFDVSAEATADASVSGGASGASGEQSLGARITFTVNVPSTFVIGGSTSNTGQSNSDPVAQVRLGSGTTVFMLTTGSNGATGTLAPGVYTLSAFADARAEAFTNSSDPSTAAGHSSVSASATLTVTPGAGCSAPAVKTLTVGLATAEGCFTERQDAGGHGTGVFETDQEAWVGGFDLKPRSGGKLVIEPSNLTAPLRAEGAGVDLVLSDSLSVPAPLGELHVFTPSFTLSLNTSQFFSQLFELPLLKGVGGQLTVTWASGGGGAKVDAQISIEDLSKNLGTLVPDRSIGTLAGSLTVTLTNGAALDLTSASLQMPEYAIELKDSDPPLKLGFGSSKFSEAPDAAGRTQWSGEVTVLFPFEQRQGSLTAGMSIEGSTLTAIKFGLSGFQEPIGKTGFDLTGVNGSMALSPQLGFDVGVTTQQHATVAGQPLFKLSGDVKAFNLATECTNGKNPFEFLLSGNSPALEQEKIGTLTTQVTMCAYLPSAENFAFEAGVSATLNVDVGSAKKVATATGSAKGWFHGTDFELDGNYALTLPVIGTLPSASGVLSSAGYAVCGRLEFISAGIGTTNWLEPPTDLIGCDFTPFKVPPPAAADIAAAGARQVAIPVGQSAFGLAVRGASGAPRVLVTGPGGARFRTGGVLLKRPNVIVIPVGSLRTTYVYLRAPRAGVWRVRAVPGSTAITRIDTARQLPKPHVRVRLVRLRHGKLRLTWRSTPIPGQGIALIDRAQGIAATIQRPTARHAGTVVFKPSDPVVVKRSIEVDVTENGRPRARLIALRYRLRSRS